VAFVILSVNFYYSILSLFQAWPCWEIRAACTESKWRRWRW